MKKIYLLMIIVMFLLFVKGVNGAFLGCCVKTSDKFYCGVTGEDGCSEGFWIEGKNIGTSACTNDVNECEKGCCIINGKGYDGNSAYYKQQCIDEGGEFRSRDCSSDTKDEIACILGGGECIWGLTSEQCSNENGEVDKDLDETKCNEKTKENEGNKRCCLIDCEYKFGYECNGNTGDRGVVCAEVSECISRCSLQEKECRNKDKKELGAEIIQRDNCRGIKYGVGFCNYDEFCLGGVCKSANCGDRSPGWKECVKKGINPGDNDYYRQCSFGDITINSCESFRREVCKDKEEEMAPGQTFDGVDCYTNVWDNCFDYKGSNENDCKAKGDCELVEGECLPKYPPGFEFWKADRGTYFISEKMCVSNYGKNKCVRSGDCDGGSGETSEPSGNGEKGGTVEIIMPNDCGYGCCWYESLGYWDVSSSYEVMYAKQYDMYGSIDKKTVCEAKEGYAIRPLFKPDSLCPSVTGLEEKDCPKDVELSEGSYCRCGDTFCKKSGGGICKAA